MKVTILSNLDHSGMRYQAGDVAELSDTVAENLAKDGVVKPYEEKAPVKAKAPSKAEEPPIEGKETEEDETLEDKPRNRMKREELIAYGESKLGLKDLDKIESRNDVLKAVMEAEKAAEKK
jgi:hypothetical protein